MLTLLTLSVALFAVGSVWFRDELSDSLFRFDFAIVNIITTIGVFVVVVSWLIWLVLFSRLSFFYSRLLPFLILVAGIAFLVLFRPIFNGGMGISRWEPRFWEWRTLADADGSMDTGLAVPTALDFTQFLGPNRNGVVDNFSVALNDLYKVDRLYKQDVGQGWSGFVARNGFAITMEQRGNDECVVCYEIETGAVAWSYRHSRRHDDALGGVGPRTTPTLDGERVYAQGANGMLVCLNVADGKLVWKQDLCELLGIELKVGVDQKGNEYQTEQTKVVWGRAGSPVVANDLVVVPGGGPLDGTQVSLIAFNKQDGSEVWRGGDQGIGYSSPDFVNLAGQDQIVSVNESSVTGHNPETGEVWWSFGREGTSNADANTSQAVLVGENRLLVSKGYGLGGELIEISGSADSGFSATSIWKNSRVLKTKLTSAIVKGEHAYALSDGILECVDLNTGKRVWKKGRYGHGQILMVSGQLLVHSEYGTLHLVDGSPDAFNEIASVDTVDGICWNTICAYDCYIIVRSDLEMACLKVSDE